MNIFKLDAKRQSWALDYICNDKQHNFLAYCRRAADCNKQNWVHAFFPPWSGVKIWYSLSELCTCDPPIFPSLLICRCRPGLAANRCLRRIDSPQSLAKCGPESANAMPIQHALRKTASSMSQYS